MVMLRIIALFDRPKLDPLTGIDNLKIGVGFLNLRDQPTLKGDADAKVQPRMGKTRHLFERWIERRRRLPGANQDYGLDMRAADPPQKLGLREDAHGRHQRTGRFVGGRRRIVTTKRHERDKARKQKRETWM
jgi:hypothetical protein